MSTQSTEMGKQPAFGLVFDRPDPITRQMTRTVYPGLTKLEYISSLIFQAELHSKIDDLGLPSDEIIAHCADRAVRSAEILLERLYPDEIR